MEKSLFPAMIILDILLILMTSIPVLEANKSVDFYFLGSKDDARFLFVGDEDVVLMCEAKEFLNPAFKVTFNGDEVFDGNNVASQNQSKLTVNVMGSCLQLTIKRLELSLNGEYKCVVTDMLVDTNDNLSSSLYLDVWKSPQCRNSGSNNSRVQLNCIHFRDEEVTWSLDLSLSNEGRIILNLTKDLPNITIGTNKISTQLSTANGPAIISFKCSLKNEPMTFCIIENNDDLFETTTISPLDNIKVSSANCSTSFSNGTQIPSTIFVQTVTETALSTSSGSSGNPDMTILLIAIIIPAVVVFLACLVVIIILCVIFKNRSQKKQEERQETVNHLFGGSVQINHHYSQYDNTKTKESSEERNFGYDSVPYTINENDVHDKDTGLVPTVSTKISQTNQVCDSAPSNEMTSNHLHDIVPDDKTSSLDPVYDEAPSDSTMITDTKEQYGNNAKGERSKEKSNYDHVDRSDHERPSSVIYATVDRKSKKSKSEKKALTNGDPTDDHVHSYMTSTRL